MTRHRPNTLKRWARFLAQLAETANVSRAARGAGFARPRVYALRASSPDFAAAWDDALETGCDRLLEEARRRAVEGVAHAVYYRGRVVGEIRRQSDRLLMFLLRRLRPEIYDPLSRKYRARRRRTTIVRLPPPRRADECPPVPVETRSGPAVLYPRYSGPQGPHDPQRADPYWHSEPNEYVVALLESDPKHRPRPDWYPHYRVIQRDED